MGVPGWSRGLGHALWPLPKGGARSLSSTLILGIRRSAQSPSPRTTHILLPFTQSVTESATKKSAQPASRSEKGRRKALGQHFLTSGRIINRIAAAAELTPQDLVVEIGPGAGALTARLLEQAGRVVAVEVDPHLVNTLPARLGNPASLTVLEADARHVDLSSLVPSGEKYKVAANLPYYAANPIVRRFLEAAHKPTLMVLTLQQEVAAAMTAAPGKMSMLSVAVQYYADAVIVCSVPPTAFKPPPKVTSAVVKLVLRPGPAVDVDDADGFFNLVRAGFSAPRKQLRNSLGHGLGLSGGTVDGLLAQAEVDVKRRAETLALPEWAAIYRIWSASRPAEDLNEDQGEDRREAP